MRRSYTIVRRTRSLNKAIPVSVRLLISGARTPRLSSPRKASTASATKTRVVTEKTGQPTPLITTSSSGPPNGNDPEGPSDPEASTEAVESETKDSAKVVPIDPHHKLPNGLNILWSPETQGGRTSSSSSALPPPDIFDQLLTTFHLTLHPQTQHKATFASAGGPPIEPTLALYCPIEGGDYILDATVRELGQRTRADIVVIDAAQLAAGENGHFGKAASVLQLNNNPLHYNASQGQSRFRSEDEDDDGDSHYPPTPQVHMQIMNPAFFSRTDRSRSVPSTRRRTSLAQLKAFFSEIINIAEPAEEGSERPTRRPRIIYIRDFPTLASSSSSWYPALLAAIRERRQGALAKLNSPILYPTTIIFGATPGITQHQPRSQAHDSATSSSSRSKAKKVHAEHSEDDVVDKAREKRLRDRLRKWEKDDTLHEEFPRLQNNGESSDGPSLPSGGYMVLDSPDAIPSALNQIFSRLGGSATRLSSFSSGKDQPGHFFRTSVVIPSTRSLLKENASRMFRRRELNELSMRMAVASVGGTLGRLEVEGSIEEDSLLGKMWTEWGRSVETWANTRHIADLVVGQATRALHEDVLSGSVSSLDATPVEWPQVFEAWTTYKGLKDSRKAWVKQSTEKTTLPEEGEEDAKEEDGVDEVVERIRKEAEDGDLDDYEEKLLGCIVDTGTISTTFNKVHLPPHTIDSVRTIVSLPLLHPDAFSHGILKEHSMTGCLLFGPPGTGKTLLVRALAKEAGCRMLAITPSDVMDMYVGEAEKAVRAVFTLARRLAPCVVFIDELDALFGARSSGSMSGGDHAHRGVITEFMQEMDGLTSSKDDNIMVIGATNRPFDLDDAVLRRLPRRLLIDLPGEKEREEILKILLRDETLEENVDTKVLAQKTETFSGSDLKHLCVSAALDSVKERVDVPWKSQSQPQAHTEGPVETKVAATEEASGASAEPTEPTTKPPRTLAWHNFEAALKEITPSSSEHLGTLADLRKWNQEFGEGRRERKKQVWGKDRFGFTIETLQKGDSTVQVGIPAGSATSTSDTR